jgi:hypothetical protein
MGKKSRSGMNISDHISESLEKQFFELTMLKFFLCGSGIWNLFLTLDLGSAMEKFGSRINIPDPATLQFSV